MIEFGTMIRAPFATHILSWSGAEAIEVEPLIADTTRFAARRLGAPG